MAERRMAEVHAGAEVVVVVHVVVIVVVVVRAIVEAAVSGPVAVAGQPPSAIAPLRASERRAGAVPRQEQLVLHIERGLHLVSA